MTIIWDGEIQSICSNCGNDCRNAIQLNRCVVIPVCDTCVQNLEIEIRNHYAIQEYGL